MRHWINYHMIAFFMGFLLDLVLGDPYYLPHPIRLIGKLIEGAEKVLRGIGDKRKDSKEDSNGRAFRQGIGLVLIVVISVVAVTLFLLFMAYWLHPVLGVVAECIMTYQILAVKCLKVESMKVYQCLKMAIWSRQGKLFP